MAVINLVHTLRHAFRLLFLTFIFVNTVHQLRPGTPMQVLVCLVLIAAKLYAINYLFVKWLMKCCFYIPLKFPF